MTRAPTIAEIDARISAFAKRKGSASAAPRRPVPNATAPNPVKPVLAVDELHALAARVGLKGATADGPAPLSDDPTAAEMLALAARVGLKGFAK